MPGFYNMPDGASPQDESEPIHKEELEFFEDVLRKVEKESHAIGESVGFSDYDSCDDTGKIIGFGINFRIDIDIDPDEVGEKLIELGERFQQYSKELGEQRYG